MQNAIQETESEQNAMDSLVKFLETEKAQEALGGKKITQLQKTVNEGAVWIESVDSPEKRIRSIATLQNKCNDIINIELRRTTKDCQTANLSQENSEIVKQQINGLINDVRSIFLAQKMMPSLVIKVPSSTESPHSYEKDVVISPS